MTEPNPILRCAGIVHVFDLTRSQICQCGTQTWLGEIPGSRPVKPTLTVVEDDA